MDHPWPNDVAVKVRMGLHTAQAAPVNGRYTGMAVHRAARICDAGHGGQILVSQATQTLLEDEEEDLAVTFSVSVPNELVRSTRKRSTCRGRLPQ